MPRESDIASFLEEKKLDIVRAIVVDLTSDNRFYAFINVSRDKGGLQKPSNVELRRLKSELLSRGAILEFILLDAKERDADTAVRASLIHNFPDIVRNSFLTIVGKNTTVWVDPKKQVDEKEDHEIRRTLEILSDVLSLQLKNVEYTNRVNLPSLSACLRALRTLSPVDIVTLIEVLRLKGFIIPSDRWVSGKLDLLRKSGQIVRLKSGLYAMSFDGLKALGSAKSGRSPDVSRLLALARRQR